MTISRSLTARLSRVAIAAGALSLLFASCEPTNPFPEYVGINLLLEGRNVTLATSSAGYLDSPVPPTPFDYIELTELTADFGPAPPGGGDVYRLEVVNLFPDGDFEATAPLTSPANWEDSIPALFQVADDPAPGLTGRYLEFDVAPTDYARLDLGAHLLDGLIAHATYHLEFDAVRLDKTSALVFDYGDAITTSYLGLNITDWTFPQAGKDDTPVETFPNPNDAEFRGPGTFYASPGADGYFYIGSPEPTGLASAGFVDNIRISRVDVMPHWAFVVPVNTDTLPLVPGRYRFRVLVKDEIDSQVTPATGNRFRSRQVTIGVNDVFRTYSGNTLGWSSGQWIEAVHEFRLTAAQLASGTPVRIQITPSSLDTPRAGSVLLSSPSLELVF